MAAPVAAARACPAFLINDARAFGLAELRLGAGRGVGTMIGLTLGTGVGGVVAVGGSVLLGHDGTAGEIGHQTIDPDGPWCGCGNRGCLEAYARADQIAAACGTETAEAAVHAAAGGDARARAGLAAVGRYLGIGIANMIAVISPDRVVLGGGVAAAGELLFAAIRAELELRVRTTALDAVASCRRSWERGPGRSGPRCTAPSRGRSHDPRAGIVGPVLSPDRAVAARSASRRCIPGTACRRTRTCASSSR